MANIQVVPQSTAPRPQFDRSTPNPATTPIATQTTTRYPSLQTEFRATREHARRLTALYGAGSPEVAAAWDAVEDILRAKAHQAQAMTPFERYCCENPDAPEARIYDV